MKTLKPVYLFSLFFSLLFIHGNGQTDSHVHAPGHFQMPLLMEDTTKFHVCGDMHQMINRIQNDYSGFKSGHSSSFKNIEEYDPDAVISCGSFILLYDDIDQDTDFGFDDPSLGAARRNTLCEVLNYIENIIFLHPNASPVIVIESSLDDPSGPLGQATPLYSENSGNDFGVDPGIYEGHLFNHINSGIDPDADTDRDGTLVVNFYFDFFNIGDPLLNELKHDLFTVLLHEMTHLMGFASMMTEFVDGEVACFNTGNSFSLFDHTFGYYGDVNVPSSFSGNKLLVGPPSNPIVNPSINLIDFPLRQANVWINDAPSPLNHNLFAGIPDYPSSSPVYNTISSSFLSHMGHLRNSFKFRQQHSPGKYIAYVMEPSLLRQQLIRQ